jgi:hypothetical protein
LEGAVGVAVFRSEDVPVGDRLDSWRTANARSIVPVVLGAVESADFRVVMRQTDLGCMSLSTLEFSPHRVARTPALIRRSDPGLYMLVLGLRGVLALSQAGRRATIGSGDLMLYDSSLPFESVVGSGPGMTRTLLLHVPKVLLPLPAPSVKGLLARRFPGREGIGTVVARALSGIEAEAARLTPADSAALSPVALDLLTALLSHHLRSDGSLETSRPDALLLRMEAFILDHLKDPQLSPAVVAAAHHVSTRSLQRLFHRQGTTASAFSAGAVWTVPAVSWPTRPWPRIPSMPLPPAGVSPARPTSPALSVPPTASRPATTARRPGTEKLSRGAKRLTRRANDAVTISGQTSEQGNAEREPYGSSGWAAGTPTPPERAVHTVRRRQQHPREDGK